MTKREALQHALRTRRAYLAVRSAVRTMNTTTLPQIQRTATNTALETAALEYDAAIDNLIAANEEEQLQETDRSAYELAVQEYVRNPTRSNYQRLLTLQEQRRTP